jgi:hypothetical protein
VRLDLTQAEAANEPGSLRLQGSTGYDGTMKIAGNVVPNPPPANTVDLRFDRVPTNARYSLKYIAADGSETLVVDNADFDSLKDNPHPGQASGAPQSTSEEQQ